MRIVMVVTNPFKPDPRVYKEAKSLAKYGHEVYVIAWDREGKYPTEEKVEGFKVIRIGPKAEYGPLMALKLPFFYLNTFKVILNLKPDVIHTHDFDTAILGFIFKLLMGVKWVYDIHDLYFTFFSMEGKRSLIGRLVRWIDIGLAKWADSVIVATQSIGGKHEGLREYYVKLGVFPERVMTIWNVPDLNEFLNDSNVDVSEKSDKYIIGFIGGQRTVSNFLELFEAIKDWVLLYKVLFVGKGKKTEALKKIVREKYPKLDVEFIDDVDYRLVSKYYRQCDVVYSCFPPRENIKRGISIKVFEATALGIPVIVNENTLNSDYVREYQCGVCVNLGNIDDLKQKILLVRTLRPFNVRVIRRKWNWKCMEKRLIGLYSKIMEG